MVNGYPFIDILELDIHQKANKHPKAFIKGHISHENAQQIMQKVATGKLLITADDHNGANHFLFCGVPDGLICSTINDVSMVEIKGIGNSALCDIEKEIRVFQDRGMSYKELTSYLEKKTGASYMIPQDGKKSIGSMFVQYNETDWEFAKRVASRLQTVVIVDNALDYPYLSIGLPNNGQRHVAHTAEYSIVKNLGAYRDLHENGLKKISEHHLTSICYRSREVYKMCDEVIINGDLKHVYSIQVSLDGSELIFTYELRDREGFKTREYYNSQIIGTSLEGTVANVEQDQIKIKIRYDVDNRRKWFDYSTPYSSPDGTGWYFMPETGDNVRLHFPTQRERDAYAISSTHITHGDRSNPEVKFIRTGRGQAITFYPDSILIDDGNGSTILMEKKNGIEIKTDKSISMQATNNIEVYGRSKVNIMGEQGVHIRNNDSLIHVEDTIDIAAAHIRVQ